MAQASPLDSDISLAHSPRSADGQGMATPVLLKVGDIALNPSESSRAGDADAPLGHHLHQVPIAKFVCDLPTGAENNDGTMEAANTEDKG